MVGEVCGPGVRSCLHTLRKGVLETSVLSEDCSAPDLRWAVCVSCLLLRALLLREAQREAGEGEGEGEGGSRKVFH